ncbi:MAG: hypothetical protein EAZ40_01965 [Rhodobacterales bacterium]|nr:MAG: hypothetical protein EAZ40_01965 [Rhodobacterales bacterium]
MVIMLCLHLCIQRFLRSARRQLDLDIRLFRCAMPPLKNTMRCFTLSQAMKCFSFHFLTYLLKLEV